MSKFDLRAALCALALLAAGPLSASQPSPLPELLREAGLQPLDPPLAAADFELPSLAGGRGSLSDFRGRWVVLTFWATWCAPCRWEMPSLESLHRSRGERGLSVVGVSVDARRGAVEPFLRELDVTFPNFWDGDGDVASAYRAGSIPLSYLIDPSARIVGLSRGARDWGALAPTVDLLLERFPAREVAEAEYAPADRALDLSRVSEPPSADVALSDPSPRAGTPFELEIRLRWSGEASEYLPQPPLVHLPEGITRRAVTARSGSEEGSHVVVYRLELVAAEPGSYALDPIDLRYLPRLAEEPAVIRLTGPSVEVEARGWGLAQGALLGGGAVILTVAVLVALRLRVGGVRQKPSLNRAATAKAHLERARELRLAGDPAAAFLELAAAEEELAAGGGPAPELPAQRIEAARYGGRPPEREELERLERRVERRLADLEEDPAAARRRSLRLRDQKA